MIDSVYSDNTFGTIIQPECRVYYCFIYEAKSKREAERRAEQLLVREAFGPEAVLEHHEDGSPYIVGRDEHISISHSLHTACMAVSEDHVIGIDVESVSERIERVKHKFLSEQAISELQDIDEEERLSALTSSWCAKEAIFKAEGETAGLLGENIDLSPLDMLSTPTYVRTGLFGYKLYHLKLISAFEERCVLAVQQRLPKIKVRERLLNYRQDGRKVLAVLLDPEKCSDADIDNLQRVCAERKPDVFLVGGSTMSASVDDFVRRLRVRNMQVPIVLFPGSGTQLSDYADGIFFLSLVSGRQAEALIGQQVKSARRIWESDLQPISVGYILVDGGKQSAVERVTHTLAISQDDVRLITDTAAAAYLLGMSSVYLEAGSGALCPVKKEVIESVAALKGGYLIVGGGITSVEQMNDAFDAGADMVVVGNYFESHIDQIPMFYNSLDRRNEICERYGR